MNAKLQTDVVYLDLRKAFDSIPHDNLLVKLHSIGIYGQLWQWFQAYFSSRSQCVVVNGVHSDTLPVTSGVPQVSILGPLLFLIFINDIPTLVQSISVLLYADDTKCYCPLAHVFDSLILQNDLESLSLWSESKMFFNKAKSFLVQFTLNSSPLPSSYCINGQSIDIKESCRDLGVIITFNLSWSDHVTYVVSKAYKLLGLIRRSFQSAPTSLRRGLYLTLVRSQLSYYCQIWRRDLLKDIKLLESVQRRAIMWILIDYCMEYKSRLQSIHLLPIMMQLEVYDSFFFLKSLSSPSDAFNILNYVTFDLSSCTRSSQSGLKHNFSRTTPSCHFYFSRLPHLWNSLTSLDLPALTTFQAVNSLNRQLLFTNVFGVQYVCWTLISTYLLSLIIYTLCCKVY